MLFSIRELIDVLVMSFALGFIFKDAFLPARKMVVSDNYDPLEYYRNPRKINIRTGFIFAMIVTVPAIVLHELGHKMLALSFGMSAEFNAAYFWLMLGIIMKLMNFGFIFFVPAYVSIGGLGTSFQMSAIAFAGPAVNLLLFLVPFLLLKSTAFRKKYKTYIPILAITARINIFLFIFNMLPIPGFDGSKVFTGLVQALF